MLTAIAILGCLAATIAVALWRRESSRRQTLDTELEEVRSELDTVRREARNRIERARREARRREREARWSAVEHLLPAIDSLESAVRQDLDGEDTSKAGDHRRTDETTTDETTTDETTTDETTTDETTTGETTTNETTTDESTDGRDGSREDPSQTDERSTLGEGLALTLQEFERGLASLDIERVHPAPGESFDADYHEALQILDDRDNSDAESDEDHEVRIHQCIRSGYRSEERVLRPAGVVVEKVSPTSDDEDSDREEREESAASESTESESANSDATSAEPEDVDDVTEPDRQSADKPVSHPTSSGG